MALDRLIRELRRPSAYPHEAGEVEVHQTHISVVFLAGEFAYKIKKPVKLGFLDYGSPDKRRHYCEEEVRLNRRLAPDVYLGVGAVVERDGALFLETEPSNETQAREWAVRMRRLPADRTLESLLAEDAVTAGLLESLAHRIADFHARADRGPEIARYGRFETVAANARDNFSQSRGQRGVTVHESVFDRLARLNEAELKRHRELIERRAAAGRPCDTHGDLRLDHVYFPDSGDDPVIVDCIEFNPAFRFADPVADMAFLAMDLRHAGRADLSRAFARAYFDSGGDGEGRRLLDFYMAYRAAVRGKVQGIKAAGAEIPGDERQRAARTARSHWLLALGLLAPPPERPALVLVGGLPGTGKSTLARGLGEAAGFRVIRSDVVRKELAGLAQGDSGRGDYGAGIYTREWTDMTYRTCRERAEALLFEGGRVIVDASFHDDEERRLFMQSGTGYGVPVLFLECRADPGTVRERLAARRGDASDADWNVYERMAERWEPPSDAVARITGIVPTGDTVAASVASARELLREHGLD